MWYFLIWCCKKIVYTRQSFDYYLSPLFCDKYAYILSMKIDTQDLALQFDNNHLPVWTNQQNDCKNEIKISSSNNYSSRPYHSLKWLVTVTEVNKVTIKILITMVGFPPSILQKYRIHLLVFWCLPLTSVLWYEVKCINWISSNYFLMLRNLSPKMKKEGLKWMK